MARPFAFDRFAFIDDVMNLIDHVGYEAASVKAICEFTGITRSSFYNAFGSREKMFIEVLAHQEMLAFDTAIKLATPPISAKALVTNIVMSMVAEIHADAEKRGCFFANAIAELAGRNHEISEALALRTEQQIAKLEEILSWAVASKQLPRFYNCRASALAVQNLMLGASLSARVISDLSRLQLMIETSLKPLGLFDENFAPDQSV